MGCVVSICDKCKYLSVCENAIRQIIEQPGSNLNIRIQCRHFKCSNGETCAGGYSQPQYFVASKEFISKECYTCATKSICKFKNNRDEYNKLTEFIHETLPKYIKSCHTVEISCNGYEKEEDNV